MGKVKATKQGKPVEVVRVKCKTCMTTQDVRKGVTQANCVGCDNPLQLT